MTMAIIDAPGGLHRMKIGSLDRGRKEWMASIHTGIEHADPRDGVIRYSEGCSPQQLLDPFRLLRWREGIEEVCRVLRAAELRYRRNIRLRLFDPGRRTDPQL